MKKKFIVGVLSLGLTLTMTTACDSLDLENIWTEGVDFEQIWSDVAGTLGLPGANSSKEIKLVDFAEMKTEEAYNFGDVYELRRMVVDEDGNEYALSYVVKDSTGKAVSVIQNCFEINDMAGYTITYTVTIAEDDVRTSVVTVPVCDGDGPTITIGSVGTAAIGEEYVLPEISFSDLNEIETTSVKVYRVVGSNLTEVTLTENEGEYSFLPNEAGTYRLSVYARDVAGNESTRNVDFIIEKILVGEVFNPAAANAQAQLYFSTNNNVFAGAEKEFVSEEENTDVTYGGSYMRVVATNPYTWGNLMLTSRFETSEYADYSLVNIWVYIESKLSTPLTVMIFNDATLTQKVTPNQWSVLSVDSTKFFTYINGGLYFLAVNYDTNTTGIRLGEVLAVNPADVTVSEPEDVVLNDESVDVEFTVTTNPTDTEYTVVVINSAREALSVEALENDNYKVTLTEIGDYTIRVSATNGRYGVAETSFTVLAKNRIVVEGEYEELAVRDKEFEFVDAYVQRGDNKSDETVTVKVYTQNGADWVDVSTEIVNNTYTPTDVGMIKVEYTATGVAPVSYEIEVCDPSVVFNPADENAAKQISYAQKAFGYDQNKVTQEFVSAEANTDTTYSGAYLRSVPGGVTGSGCYGRILLTAKLPLDSYESYDLITIWLYVESKTNDAVRVEFFNDANLTQLITPNQWVQIRIARSLFMGQINTAPCFNTITYDNPTAIRLGEIRAENYDESTNLVFDPTAADTTKISTNKSSTITFTQINQDANADYSGAYVKVAPSSLTTTNNWINIKITPIADKASYSGRTLKVWIYVETNVGGDVAVSFSNVESKTVTSNQWVQVEIDADKWIAEANGIFAGMNFNSNGIKAIRIGEVVVK